MKEVNSIKYVRAPVKVNRPTDSHRHYKELLHLTIRQQGALSRNMPFAGKITPMRMHLARIVPGSTNEGIIFITSVLHFSATLQCTKSTCKPNHKYN